MKAKEYRKDLERLKDKKFIVVADVAKRSTKLETSIFGTTYKVSTMLLTNVKCCVRKDNKLKIAARVHHVWISAESNKIVNHFKIKAGHEVMFGAEVTEYTYKDGTKQLGLVQTSKSFKFR